METQQEHVAHVETGLAKHLLVQVCINSHYITMKGLFQLSGYSITLLTARYAKWHVRQQQRYATSACPWPFSVDFPMSGLIRSFLLQRYAATLSWASLCAVFTLVSRKGMS